MVEGGVEVTIQQPRDEHILTEKTRQNETRQARKAGQGGVSVRRVEERQLGYQVVR